ARRQVRDLTAGFIERLFVDPERYRSYGVQVELNRSGLSYQELGLQVDDFGATRPVQFVQRKVPVDQGIDGLPGVRVAAQQSIAQQIAVRNVRGERIGYVSK